MTHFQEQAIALIETQQKGIENTAPWVAGEQLKDIIRREPVSAELLAHDLTVAEMSLTSAEKKIKEWADKHKKGSFSYVPPHVAEGILREFYGLGKAGETPPDGVAAGLSLNLTDFL
jgi:hypothetical protein